MDVWMIVRTYSLMDCRLDAWLGECVCWLLVSSGPAGPLVWRIARKPIGRGQRGLWRGLISRKPELLLTINQHVFILLRIQSSIPPSVRTLTHTSNGWVNECVGEWMCG